MKLSLFWKLMLAFTLVVAIGLGAVVILANQVTASEFHQMMMSGDGQGMMMGQTGPGQNGPGPNGMAGYGQAFMQQAALERVNRAVLMGGLIALIAALVVGFFIFRAITRPIDQLTHAAHQLAQGDLTARVTVDDHPARLGSDEISELGAAFNTMASSLQQSEQVRRDMTADIAHELRTPLAVMRGNLEAMLDGVYPFDAEHLDPVLNQVNLLTRLVEDLRTLALAEAGQLPLTKRPVDLAALLQSVWTSFEAQAAAQQVTLHTAIASDLPTIEIDPDRMQQTVGILISNALRYTPPRGSITLATKTDRASVTIEVADTGSGIAPEDLPHVFDRFYRADKSRARESGGSGLGLAIAKSIVEAHGGSITAASQFGQGTQLIIRLPRAA
jgi:signal transduction histidine kinase